MSTAIPSIRAVTFDLDGTLIDSTDAIVESFLHAFEILGEPAPSPEAVIATISLPLKTALARLTEREPADFVPPYRDHYAKVAPVKTTLLPGARESLDRLTGAGIALAMATSKRREAAEMLLAHFGIGRYFRFCLGPEDVSRPKPDPEPILLSARKLNVSPSAMVYAGDTTIDIQAAQAAGVRCLCVTTGYADRGKLEAMKPDGVFDSLIQLTDYVLENMAGRGEIY